MQFLEDELPEGVEINAPRESHLELEDIERKNIDSFSCTHCECSLSSYLLTNFNRYSGSIETQNQQVVWHNPLPKKLDRALQVLADNFSKRVDLHVRNHKND